jgi:hypothetical protein
MPSISRLVLSCLVALSSVSGAAEQDAPPDIILFTSNASLAGSWRIVSDTTAAQGRAAVLPNAGRAKVLAPVANPSDYFELTFDAVANTPYRIWVRGRADGNNRLNDSVHVQFSNSVNATGTAAWRIGTTSGVAVNLEDCSGCGNAGWGWEDNGWGTPTTLGPEIRFATTGPQRLRVQNREDGFFIDHVVLSPSTYLTSAPGANKNDTTILDDSSPSPSSAAEIVIHAASAQVRGAWQLVSDAAAASGIAAVLPNAGRAKVLTPVASPADYFEVTFPAVASTPYRLWLRGRATGNDRLNDSVYVQFTNSINASGAAAWRIGTTSGVAVNLEDCSGCGNAGWGWEDNGWGTATMLGPEIRFVTSGTQRLRVQNREDGFFIDQIVLSPAKYLDTAPGANKNDTTILAPTVTVPPPTPTVTLVRAPYLTVFDRSATIVWASRESGAGSVRIDGRTIAASTRLVRATTTGLSTDYYQHETRVSGLNPSTTYAYEARVGSARAATSSLKTAPSAGTGSIRFIAFGDSGTGTTAQRTLASRMAADTWDFAVHAGDIAYGTSSTSGNATYATYHSWFFDIYRSWLPTRAFFPAMGNHDGRPGDSFGAAYRDLFVLPAVPEAAVHSDEERYYTFQYGPAQFFVLDTEQAFIDTTRRQTQLQWLTSALSSSTSPWKVAVFHKAPYSTGRHGSNLAVRQAFGPLLERYGVQLALVSHDHIFERSVPWRESTDRAQQGVTYVVTGGGGGALYPVGMAAWTARSASRHHYVRTNISGCVLTLDAIGTDGVSFDRFTLDRCIQRSDAGNPTVRITSPANNAKVSGVITVAIAATDDTRVEKVDLWVDGVLKGLDRTSAYSITWDSRTVPAGTHRLEARAYDLAGNKVRSTIITVTTTGL